MITTILALILGTLKAIPAVTDFIGLLMKHAADVDKAKNETTASERLASKNAAVSAAISGVRQHLATATGPGDARPPGQQPAASVTQ